MAEPDKKARVWRDQQHVHVEYVSAFNTEVRRVFDGSPDASNWSHNNGHSTLWNSNAAQLEHDFQRAQEVLRSAGFTVDAAA